MASCPQNRVLPLRKRSFIIIVQRGHDKFLNILLVGWWWGKWECCQLKSWPLPTKAEWKTRRQSLEEIERWLLFSARGEWNTVGSCLKNCAPHEEFIRGGLTVSDEEQRWQDLDVLLLHRFKDSHKLVSVTHWLSLAVRWPSFWCVTTRGRVLQE